MSKRQVAVAVLVLAGMLRTDTAQAQTARPATFDLWAAGKTAF